MSIEEVSEVLKTFEDNKVPGNGGRILQNFLASLRRYSGGFVQHSFRSREYVHLPKASDYHSY